MKNAVPYQEMTINTRDITIDPAYQREIKSTKIAKIVREFDPVLANPPKVSFRDGRYYCFDGQHTIVSQKTRNGGNDLDLRCRVYFGLTQQDEYKYFLAQNGTSSAVTGNDKLRAMFNNGEREVIDMVKTAEKCGFIVDFKMGQYRYHIAATDTLYRLHKVLQRDQFISMLNIIKNAWGGEYESLRREILNGVGLFVKTYHGQFQQKALEKALANVEPISIVRNGRGLSASSKDYSCYARAILRIYNKNRTTHRLDDQL